MDTSDDIAARAALLRKSAQRRRAALDVAEAARTPGMSVEELQQAVAVLAEVHAQAEAEFGSLLVLEIARIGRDL